MRLLLRGVPAEFAEYFRPQTPLLLGGLLTHEAVPQSTKDTGVNGLDMGYLTTRVKRHRWHKRILKSNDPLIFSIGWRRFQVCLQETDDSVNVYNCVCTCNCVCANLSGDAAVLYPRCESAPTLSEVHPRAHALRGQLLRPCCRTQHWHHRFSDYFQVGSSILDLLVGAYMA